MLTDQLHADVMARLATIEDPELGVNIVDLGLIYGLDLIEDTLTIDMTLTYAGCPLTDMIESDINDALLGYKWHVVMNWVWLPPWDMSLITDEGRDQLRSLGALL